MKGIIKTISSAVVGFMGRFLIALIIYAVGRIIIRKIRKWLKTSHKLDNIDVGVRTFLISFSGIVLNILLFITLAIMLGIPATSFVAAIASCGVAIGLAMQGSLSNVAGGIMILIFKPFKIDDYIATPETSGTVKNISVFYTFLSTPDNRTITVPNGTLMNSVVENYSTSDKRRVDITFTVSNDTDIDKVIDIMQKAMEEHPHVLKDPEPFARFSNQTPNAMEFTMRAWCETDKFWDVKFDLLETVKREFVKNNIMIPSNKLDVHIDNK